MAAAETRTTDHTAPAEIWAVALLWHEAGHAVVALWQDTAADEADAVAQARAARPDAPATARHRASCCRVSISAPT